MLVIGLTGGIATGKSTVAAMFERRNCAVIDADRIAREVVEPGSFGLESLCLQFGRGILDGEGRLDRAGLGKRVFGDPALLARLNEILHPLILTRIGEALEAFRQAGEEMVLLDAPLLFETGFHGRVDAVVVVYAAEEVQRRRLMERDGLTPEEAGQRIASQMPLEDKVRQADFVIDNGSTPAAAEEQVKETMKKLQERALGWKKNQKT